MPVSTASLVWTLERQERAQQRTQAADVAGDHVQALQRAIELALSANNTLVALVRQGHGNVPQFEEIGMQMLPFYPGIAAMGLSPGGVVQQVVPRAGNENSIGFDQLNDPRQGAESARARESGLLTLAGPMELVQGGLGVVGRQPVYLEDDLGRRNFWGFTYVTIRLPEVLATARLPQLTERGFHYRLWRVRPDNQQEQTIAASDPPSAEDAVGRSLTLPNGQWTLSLSPAQGWGAPGVLALRCALGLLFALLMGYLARLLIELKAHERGLATQVAQRTSEIQATQQQLRATIDAIPDPLFEIDQDGRYCSVHSPRTELLMGPADQLIGRNVTDVLPALAALTVMDVLNEAQSQGWSTGRQIMLDLPGLGPTWFELSAARKAGSSGGKPRFIVLSRDISERKRSQEQLQLTAQVFDQSGEAIVIADAAQTIVRINRAFSRITGYSEAEAVGQSMRLLTVAESTRDFDADLVYTQLSKDGHWEGEAWGRRKDGSTYPQWLSVSRVRDGNGSTTHSITLTPPSQRAGVPTDTPLQRTLREQQILLDSAGVGIVFLRQRSVVRCNQRYAEIFGYASPAHLVGLNTEAFYPDRDAFRDLGRTAYPALAQGQSFRIERQLRRQDGTLFWGSLTGRLINPHDTGEGSIWIVDDIDEQKRAQAALNAAVREKQLLFDSAMVGIVFLRDRHLTRCNHHFEQMLGFEPGELMGCSSRRWYASDAAWQEVGDRCYPTLVAGQSYEGEVELCRKDGTPVICEVRSKCIDPADPAQGTIWITMDITDRKRAQAMLAQAHEELERQVQDRTRELRETVANLHQQLERFMRQHTAAH
eukprot:gene986-966_t